MKAAGEPSVEEILDSIKKVIARDNRTEAEQLRRRREQEGIVVTSPANDRAAVDPPAYPAGDEPAPVLELTDAELAPQPAEAGRPAPNEPHAAEENDVEDEQQEIADEPLVAGTARSSVRESLAALAMLAEPGARPQIVRSGETSLEQLTRDLLKPMLAEWLEKHLPDTVDRLVAAEISRIVGKKI